MSPLRLKWLIALIATAMAFLEVMDMVVVAVSMRSIGGSLSASPSQIGWTMSAYMISAGLITPLTGLLVARYGRRKVLLTGVIGFGVFSGGCGLSTSLTMMMIFRVLQGAFGAPLASIAQSTMAEFFHGEERNKAMALFSIGIMTAPLIGCIIGGYINDEASWRFIFFINLPLCAFIYYFASRYVPESSILETQIDWPGLVMLLLGIGLLQFSLADGSYDGWFHSWIIMMSLMLGVFSLSLFIVHSQGRSDSIIPLEIFRDKNFVRANILGLLFNAGFMAATPLISIQLESVLNYPASHVGYLLIPRGLSSILSMFFMPTLMRHLNAVTLMMIGFGTYAFGTYLLSQQFSIDISQTALLSATVFQGMATAFFFVPLSVLAYKTLRGTLSSKASGIFNFTRSLGGSIGISVYILIQETLLQRHWNSLTSAVYPTQQAFMVWARTESLPATSLATLSEAARWILRPADMLSYANTYFLISVALFFGLALTGFLFSPFTQKSKHHVH